MASPICRSTRPLSVNLKAFDSRFLSTCCSRFASVEMARGQLVVDRDVQDEALRLRHRAEGPIDVLAQVGERQLADLDRHRARLDLGHVEDVVDQRRAGREPEA